MKTFLCLIACVCLVGCVNVPSNKITLGDFKIDAPKNVTADGIEVIRNGNDVHVRINRLASTDSPQVIDSSAAGQAAIMAELRALVSTLVEVGKKAAAP